MFGDMVPPSGAVGKTDVCGEMEDLEQEGQLVRVITPLLLVLGVFRCSKEKTE